MSVRASTKRCSVGVDAHLFDTGMRSFADLEAARFDRVFIALHGRYGEDGTIQGRARTAGHSLHRQRTGHVGHRHGQDHHQAPLAAALACPRRISPS